MQLARFLNKIFKKGGFVLTDANYKDYIIGEPDNNPIKLKILNKNLHYKLLFHPDLYFGEAYTNGEIIIENGTLTDFLDPFLKSFIAFLNFILKLLLCPTVVLKSSNLGFIFLGTVDLSFDKCCSENLPE